MNSGFKPRRSSSFSRGRSLFPLSMPNEPPKWQSRSKINPEKTADIYMRSGWGDFQGSLPV